MSNKNYVDEMIKKIRKLYVSHSSWRVFEDFLVLSAISISNAVDSVHKAEREEHYKEVAKRYSADEIKVFPELLTDLVNALESEMRPTDVLGKVFHSLELHKQYKGQYFTPQNVCDMMAEMMFGENDPNITEKGYITVNEPTCGSGAMIMAAAHVLLKRKMNPRKHIVVTATDIDIKCVHMCYLQCSLWGIPAVIIHGNTLTMEEWSRWYTPFYLLDGWLWRQSCGNLDGNYTEDEALKKVIDPVYHAIRLLENATSDEDKPMTKEDEEAQDGGK